MTARWPAISGVQEAVNKIDTSDEQSDSLMLPAAWDGCHAATGQPRRLYLRCMQRHGHPTPATSCASRVCAFPRRLLPPKKRRWPARRSAAGQLVWFEYGLHLTNRQPSESLSGLAWRLSISTTTSYRRPARANTDGMNSWFYRVSNVCLNCLPGQRDNVHTTSIAITATDMPPVSPKETPSSLAREADPRRDRPSQADNLRFCLVSSQDGHHVSSRQVLSTVACCY